MELTHRRLPTVDVLELSGRMMAGEAAQLRERIEQLFSEGRSRVLLDLSKLEYISSGGLRVLVEARKRAREQKASRSSPAGDVRILHLPPEIKRVFDMTGVTTLFHVHDDLVEAVGSF